MINQEKLSLAQLKTALPDVNSAFLSRVARELEREGRLRKCDDGHFVWTCEPRKFPVKAWVDRKLRGPQLPNTPAEDRPRERLLALGAPALRTAELLAILIRSGRPGESALQAGERIAARYADELDRLADAGRGELKAVSAAVGDTAYCQIMAGIELGRRVARAGAERQERTRRISGSAGALAFCRHRFGRLASDGTQEEFHIVCLDTKYAVINTHRVSVGSLDRSLVHPREVFRPAIKDAAKAILLVHNHPSGDPTPSDEDFTLTTRLEEAARTLGIQVLDHIIVARGGAVSICERRQA